MRLLLSIIFYTFVGLSSAKASLIDYEFNTLIFSDNHQVTGGFTLDSDTNELVALSVSLLGSIYDIEFDISHLTSADAFSIRFDNMTFGDGEFEGFSLFKNDVYLATGEYGYGGHDTCYAESSEVCTGNLFTFQQSSSAVDAPGASYLLGMGLILLFRRRMFS